MTARSICKEQHLFLSPPTADCRALLAINFGCPLWNEAISQGALNRAGQQHSPSSLLASGDPVGQQPGKQISPSLCSI